jgi:RHS repeat-associated protein
MYLYCGEQYDADLGMYSLRARYMEPGRGRFWTQDEYEGRNADPETLHKYLFCSADPVNGGDPSGFVIIANFVYGQTVHDEIGLDFEEGGFGVSDATISRILGVPSIFGNLRPDLTTLATLETPGQVYEIKSVITGYANAAAQLGFYLVVLNVRDPLHRKWLPGFTYNPPGIIYINNGTFALVKRAGPGVILYEVVNKTEAGALLGVAAAGIAAEIVGFTAVAITTSVLAGI